MEKKVIVLEEQDTSAFACIAGAVVSLLAGFFVMFFLNGTKSDLIVLISPAFCVLIYFIQKYFQRLQNLYWHVQRD